MNILRRLPLSRLLLLCALAVAIGISATALAFAVTAGPTPPAKPLAQAIHDALSGASKDPAEGFSANVVLTNHLLEGASLASGGGAGAGGGGVSSPQGELSSNPLITGASGRLWVAKDGHARLELQSQQGDTEIVYDGHTVTLYDATSNTIYRYTPPAHEGASASDAGPSSSAGSGSAQQHEVPTVSKIEEAISHLQKHAHVSGAAPTDVGGQAAYTVRLSPNESGSLFGGVELSFDAAHGIPLRVAIYSTTSSSPVIELAASEVSYGPVSDSVFELNPPASAKVQEIKLPSSEGTLSHDGTGDHEKPNITTHGHGIATIAVIESKAKSGQKSPSQALQGLPEVTINGASASELRTALGTVLSFERSGVNYLLAGSVTPAAIEEVARGL
jgi:outer membrane lipoprotein-sorting protein